jgi:hypothetical protein
VVGTTGFASESTQMNRSVLWSFWADDLAAVRCGHGPSFDLGVGFAIRRSARIYLEK